MKTVILSLILFILLFSCSRVQKNANENVIVKNCNEFSQEDLNRFCADYKLDVLLRRPISTKTYYYIWKKHGINIYQFGSIDDLDPDSCNRRKSFQFYQHKYGIDVINDMYKDLDSLIRLEGSDSKRENNFFDKYDLVFEDGKYSNYLIIKRNDRLKRDTIFSDPKLKNDSIYNKVFKDLWNLYRKNKVRDNLIFYWYVIGKDGDLVEIEIMNQNCPDSVEQNIFNYLKKIKWYPAKFNGENVEYRDYDFF
jgi:hypothetical protein